MMTVGEVAKLSGVTVRTLHHYDAIGLLAPATITDAGYRLYDEKCLERLQFIMLLKELGFQLKEIAGIIDDPSLDFDAALDDQIALLELERKRIERLIEHAKSLKEKGVSIMNFDAYDEAELEAFREEAKAKWGESKAFKEFEANAESGADLQASGEALMSMFAECGELKELGPAAAKVQQKIGALQQYITDNFYTCTNEILLGLGQMYVADERFKQNIDNVGGNGTADFVSEAIAIYCDI